MRRLLCSTLLLVAQATFAAEPTRADIVAACASKSGGPALEGILKEVMDISADQRRDYVRQWLDEHHVKETECPSLLERVTPTVLTEQVGKLTLSWKPAEADEPNCFEALSVDGVNVTLPNQFCFAHPREVRQEDFNFDGKPDLRLVGPLQAGHSRRFDLVLLATKSGFVRSEQLSTLDDVIVEPKAKRLTSRTLNEDHISHRTTWRWNKDTLKQLSR